MLLPSEEETNDEQESTEESSVLSHGFIILMYNVSIHFLYSSTFSDLSLR